MILVVGDVMDDLVVRPLGPLVPRSDTPAHMERHPGGSGANTAAWLGVLGAEVRFAGRVGLADLRRHARALEALRRRRAPGGRRPHADRQHRRPRPRPLDVHRPRGQPRPRRATTCPTTCSRASTTCTSRATRCWRRARASAVLDLVARAGVPWSVDPASHAFVADTPFLEWTAGASVCFPNEDEARVLGDGLADAYEVVVLKRGREGVRVLRRGAEPVDVPAATAAAVDQTGAGDAFAAGYLAALVRGEDDAACARAAVARRDRGGRPPRRPAAVRPAPRLAGGGSQRRSPPPEVRGPRLPFAPPGPATRRPAALPRCPGRAAPQT